LRTVTYEKDRCALKRRFGLESLMKIEKFEAKIRNLKQEQLLTGAISSLNKLLVDKGIINEDEIQNYFLNWVSEHHLQPKKPKRRAAN